MMAPFLLTGVAMVMAAYVNTRSLRRTRAAEAERKKRAAATTAA